ncbi:hypothetical protein CLAFUW4_03052 [Fulvia fulva]|nr:hypothetical protein CLAFUR4_03045 [Fulvia fulva]KAK4633354.1 hypothetical protein CLAFUR0_03048 [Fulvia fulva]WPV11953.1 hypothetical protein CLAFUW4_03052 [Fulvia fulva]WPV25441.1 hypothetical protein CLAFUW7_03049 [Fulvia fulva]
MVHLGKVATDKERRQSIVPALQNLKFENEEEDEDNTSRPTIVPASCITALTSSSVGIAARRTVKMKRFTGLLNRTKSISQRASSSNRDSTANNFDNAPVDSPEANAPRAIRSFCESGSNSNGGEEVLHLPVIVESAESSPSAAAAAAHQIKKFLGKEYSPQPHVQYNAIMLVRILCDNPGPTFTRNFDKSFVGVVKDLLRNCRDPSTQQIMRETLDSLEAEKQQDEGLGLLFQMWRKEKGAGASFRQSRAFDANAFASAPQQQQMGREGRARGTLPSAGELASRVEEAKNTAKILLQFVQTTPSGEVLDNELLREFSERCQSAQRSMQGFINCDNPAPDHDTMQTLIETNEQLSLAMSRHQRAVLAARRALGTSPSPNNAAAGTENGGHSMFAAPPAGPPQAVYSQQPSAYTNGNGNTSHFQGYSAPSGPPPGQRSSSPPQQNPFADPVEHNPNPAPLAIEPTHYGSYPQQQQSQQAPPKLPPHKPQIVDFQTFNIEPDPTFAQAHARKNTLDLENAYSDSDGMVSPILSRSAMNTGPPSEGLVSPSSPQRPAIGAWHNSEVTPSYMGRQESAANGITMHGAQSDDNVQEIDRHSQVGRRDRDRTDERERYDVSPVEARQQHPQEMRRVEGSGSRF